MDQKENTKHGETFFPVQKYITRLADDYPAVTIHWHEEAELTLITEGSCIYQIDFVEYEVKAGDLLFVPPLLLHSIVRTVSGGEDAGTVAGQKKYDKLRNNKNTDNENTNNKNTDNENTDNEKIDSDETYSETYVFHMNFLGGNTTDICSTRYLVPIMNQEISLPCLITPEHPAYVSLRKIFGQITSLYNEAVIGYELALKALFLQAVFLLLQYRWENVSPNNRVSSDKLKQVLDYIEDHYAEPISVTELAKLCYFSDYHFMRFFKKHMSMTCVEYINNLRLEKSVELFEKGNTSILDVSLSVGFRNLSYFHRAFKKKYHVTPHAFIKELS